MLAQERDQHHLGDEHEQPTPQQVRDVQRSAADARVPHQGEVQACTQHRHDGGNEEDLKVAARVYVASRETVTRCG